MPELAEPLVTQLRAELDVHTPADRGPGRAWEMGPAIDAAVPEAQAKPTRVGYARCGTAPGGLLVTCFAARPRHLYFVTSRSISSPISSGSRPGVLMSNLVIAKRKIA